MMPPKKAVSARGHIVHLVCPHCAKEFNGNASTSGVRSNYRRHLLIHTGERPFACPYCHDGFTTNPNLRRHIAAFHAIHLTPPNGTTAQADDAEVDPPMAPLELPTATTSASPPATSSASAGLDKQGSTAAIVETNGLTFAGAPHTVSEPGSEDMQQPSTTTASTFICEDCELEVSSQAKLHRHQRYYCPFRDNIFVDPVQDALKRYQAEQQQQQQETAEEEEDAEEVISSAGSDEDAFPHRSSRSNSVLQPRRRHRRGKKSTSALALTKAEKDYLTRIAAQSGLKFVEDAYASDDGSDDDEVESGSYTSYSGSSEGVSGADAPDDGNETEIPPLRSLDRNRSREGGVATSPFLKSKLSPFVGRVSPMRTPLHGPLLPFSDKKALRSPPSHVTQEGGKAPMGGPRGREPLSATEVTSGDAVKRNRDDGEVEDGCDVDPGEDLLHLHFHRRGSGHKRERHILRKRLRAQEGVLLGLTRSPLLSPQKQPRADLASVCTRTARADNAMRTASSRFDQHRLNTTSIVVSEQLVSQAASLHALNQAQSYRHQDGVSSEFICPYCNDFTVFATHRRLTAHMRRMHPAEVTRNAARVAAQEDGSTTDSTTPPSP